MLCYFELDDVYARSAIACQTQSISQSKHISAKVETK